MVSRKKAARILSKSLVFYGWIGASLLRLVTLLCEQVGLSWMLCIYSAGGMWLLQCCLAFRWGMLRNETTMRDRFIDGFLIFASVLLVIWAFGPFWGILVPWVFWSRTLGFLCKSTRVTRKLLRLLAATLLAFLVSFLALFLFLLLLAQM